MRLLSSAVVGFTTFLVVMSAASGTAAEELAGSLIATISSSSGRIAVGGIEPQRALHIALEAEKLVARIESGLGRRVLPARMKVVVAITPADADASGRIRLRPDPSGVRPVIEVTWDGRTSEEDVLEAVGMVIIRQLRRGSGVQSPGAPPWWTGAGLARYVRPEVRVADYRRVYTAWQDELLPPLADFAVGAPPPTGAGLEKSISAALFGWIVQSAGGLRQALNLISRFPDNERADLWLARILAGGDPRRLQYGWELFVAGSPRFTTGSEEPEFLRRRIQSAIRVSAAQAGTLLGRPFDRDPDLSSLMDLPFEERRLMAAWLSVRLQQSVPARYRGMADVVEHLVRFFQLLRRPRLDRVAAARELAAAGVAPRPGESDGVINAPVPAR